MVKASWPPEKQDILKEVAGKFKNTVTGNVDWTKVMADPNVKAWGYVKTQLESKYRTLMKDDSDSLGNSNLQAHCLEVLTEKIAKKRKTSSTPVKELSSTQDIVHLDESLDDYLFMSPLRSNNLEIKQGHTGDIVMTVPIPLILKPKTFFTNQAHYWVFKLFPGIAFEDPIIEKGTNLRLKWSLDLFKGFDIRKVIGEDEYLTEGLKDPSFDRYFETDVTINPILDVDRLESINFKDEFRIIKLPSIN